MARNAENTKRLQKEWYEQNKEITKERAKDWVLKNPEKRKEVANKYAKSNTEKQRNSALKRQYGITLEEFNSKITQQENKCAICGNNFKDSKDACMDHCHSSEKVRDVLCRSCNMGLGYFKDSMERLLAAAQYLNKHK